MMVLQNKRFPVVDVFMHTFVQLIYMICADPSYVMLADWPDGAVALPVPLDFGGRAMLRA